MMPHIALPPRHSSLTALLLRHPSVDVALLARADGEPPGRHVFADRRPRADVRALADRDRRDELAVAADEGAVLDHRLVLVRAVVVARDHAGADVHLVADRRVPQVREMVRFRAFAERRLFQLGEIADVRVLADVGLWADMRERTDLRAGADARLADDAEVVDHHAVVERRVHDAYARVDHAALADPRPSFEVYVRMDDRVAANLDVRPDPRRRGIDDRHAGVHERLV